MSFQACIDFILENPHCALATSDGEQARVRGMMALWAREDGIYFTTGGGKDLYEQMTANPRVEVCFMVYNPIKHLRITGEVEFVDDLGQKTQALEERSFLRALGFVEASDPDFILFRIAHGEAHFWTWADNTKEAEIPRISF